MAVEKLGIVGSGIMGSGVAEVAARAGMTVVLRSRKQETADALVAGLGRSLAKQVKRGKLDEAEAEAVAGRVSATADLEALSDCDLVLESIVEDLETKKQLFGELDRLVKDGALLATNTSTLPVVEMAIVTSRPERVCGIHFFNPAPAMALVEVVRTLLSSEETIAEAKAFADACAKSPVVVEDRAGFIVNGLLFPYLNNAVRMLENRTASRDDIDAAMKGGCNFPMGPLALLDLVGLDTSLAILDALYTEFRDPNYAAVPLLRRMVAAGHLGRKSGRGFYDYARG
jgi:3-hydroxybutyryl-CoA dehydrogenase